MSKDTSNRFQLQHYLTVLKDKRAALFDEYRREKVSMKETPGELSKLDADAYCLRVDKEMHELYQEITDVQKRIDELGSDS